MSEEKTIDPWGAVEVKDYSSAFQQFGLQQFPEEWRKKLDHPLFRRKIVIAHRDFEPVMAAIVAKKPFINMTGIATSGPLHFGHKMVIDLFMFLHSLGATSHFGIADIDAYVSRPDSKLPSLEKAKEYAIENLANALALGVPKKNVFVQSRMPSRYYEFAFEVSKKMTSATFEAIYGHIDLGKVSANLLQYADILHPQLKEFGSPAPTVVPIAIEQDPHIRAVRDIAKRLPYKMVPPSSLYITHQPGLREGMKMSSSVPETAIFLTDPPEIARKKIMTAFTGGRDTAEEQHRLGANPEVCKVCNFLKFHFQDDKKVSEIWESERKGKTLCGEVKLFTADFVEKWLKQHQAKFKKFKPVAEKMIYG
jgi:tryptophanyl-tRNA synthetase